MPERLNQAVLNLFPLLGNQKEPDHPLRRRQRLVAERGLALLWWRGLVGGIGAGTWRGSPAVGLG